MQFAYDTRVALATGSALVNTVQPEGDLLADRAGLDRFLVDHPYTGRIDGDGAELRAVRDVRDRLRALWDADARDDVVVLVNALLADSGARPFLARHDEWDWHLHLSDPEAPLADRIAAESAMAFVDLIRADDLDRLQRCAAPDCDDVLVDLSRNRSKRYCDTGNCGNRQHVAAYRARRAR
ncbi:CGNR zinc finger domain-containing protein [Solicola gregarius]|uniref:CGNR zinc finger domain-containing protein n=1 Tax=Solicola gregarius TaxID=2908642 RepID=A0AA46TI74_9ACTN|nr:CGNR zinc finger domain-containing protein [Solicola gregarius]UYM05725.1 CGNR zinc finger domain-containing protein [Solicola gregarius]